MAPSCVSPVCGIRAAVSAPDPKDPPSPGPIIPSLTQETAELLPSDSMLRGRQAEERPTLPINLEPDRAEMDFLLSALVNTLQSHWQESEVRGRERTQQ